MFQVSEEFEKPVEVKHGRRESVGSIFPALYHREGGYYTRKAEKQVTRRVIYGESLLS